MRSAQISNALNSDVGRLSFVPTAIRRHQFQLPRCRNPGRLPTECLTRSGKDGDHSSVEIAALRYSRTLAGLSRLQFLEHCSSEIFSGAAPGGRRAILKIVSTARPVSRKPFEFAQRLERRSSSGPCSSLAQPLLSAVFARRNA